VRQNGLLVVRTSGAYGAVMSSNYNSRPRPAEVMVDGDNYHIIRKRESLDAMLAGEKLIP
jgi:diaminopimelate decarboxylase